MEWISGFTNSFGTSAVRILTRCVLVKCVLMCVGGRQCVSICHGWIVGRVCKGVCVFFGECAIYCVYVDHYLDTCTLLYWSELNLKVKKLHCMSHK